jgi:hypothetical protein
MRLSISVAAGAALCVAAGASADVVTKQTFEITPVNGGFIYADTPRSPYLMQKYGKNSGYLFEKWNGSYVPFQGSSADLLSATLKITIDLGYETGFDLPISFNFMLYTGSDASPQKHFEVLQKTPIKTDNDGKFVYNKTFTAVERAVLASSAGVPYGTFFAEIFSTFSFGGKITAEFTTTAVPGPGGALAMTIFAMGGLARRRRAG